MSKLRLHIPRGERTRRLFCLVSALVAALFMLTSGPARRGKRGEWRLPVAVEAVRPAASQFAGASATRGRSSRPLRPRTADDGRREVRLPFRRRHLGPERDGRSTPSSAAPSAASRTRSTASTSRVLTANGRSFEYWHVRAAVRPGQRVEAGATVLGTIMAPFEHVHFAEIQSGRAGQPACRRPPDAVHRHDEAERSSRSRSGERRPAPRSCRASSEGRVLMVAEAYDTRQLPFRAYGSRCPWRPPSSPGS